MVFAMLLGGLRRCEVLGLRLEDVNVADRSLFVVDGKGGHQRKVPISNVFFSEVGDYLHTERPAGAPTNRVFVTLKGPSRGQGLSAQGVETILLSAKERAGLRRATCHQLRHTCLTRLREAGMALEAVQAQAGHRSIESTRIYLHLTNEWLAAEYRRAAELIDATYAAELDCRMESICETCAYFRTGPEFVPVLLRQRDHARQHGQRERANLFEDLVNRVSEASA
jgi:integrase/recombinase XerD